MVFELHNWDLFWVGVYLGIGNFMVVRVGTRAYMDTGKHLHGVVGILMLFLWPIWALVGAYVYWKQS